METVFFFFINIAHNCENTVDIFPLLVSVHGKLRQCLRDRFSLNPQSIVGLVKFVLFQLVSFRFRLRVFVADFL